MSFVISGRLAVARLLPLHRHLDRAFRRALHDQEIAVGSKLLAASSSAVSSAVSSFSRARPERSGTRRRNWSKCIAEVGDHLRADGGGRFATRRSLRRNLDGVEPDGAFAGTEVDFDGARHADAPFVLALALGRSGFDLKHHSTACAPVPDDGKAARLRDGAAGHGVIARKGGQTFAPSEVPKPQGVVP